MKRLERQASAYCRRVAKKLPFHGQHRKDYLAGLRYDVMGYLSTHPWAEQRELTDAFGAPEQIAVAFISEMSYAEIHDRICARNRALRLVFLAVGASMLLLIAMIVYMLLRNKQDMEGHFIVTQMARSLGQGAWL